jgi:ABC-type glycerol-3-phosphate transport system substrate-binding protein
MRKTIVPAVIVLMACALATPAFATGTEETATDEPVVVRALINGREPAEFDDDVHSWVEQQIADTYGLNMDLQVIPHSTGEFENRLNLMIASRDIDTWNWNKETEYLNDGALLEDLGPSLDQYGQHVTNTFEDWMWETTTVDGEIRAIPIYEGFYIGAGKVFWVRMDLLEEFGMEWQPTMKLSDFEAYLDWAMETYPDLLPLGRTTNVGHVTKAIFKGLSYPENPMAGDGTVKPYFKWAWPYEPEYRERLETLARWWDKGYVDSDWMTWERTRAREIVRRGDMAASSASWWSGFGYFTPLRENLGEEYGIISLERDDGQPLYASSYGSWGGNRAVYVLKDSGVADHVVALQDWMATNVENSLVGNLGIPGEHWNYSDDGQNVEYFDGLERGEHYNQVYSAALGNCGKYFSGEMRSYFVVNNQEESTVQELFDLHPSEYGAVYPDAGINYGALNDIVRERGIRFNETDAETFIEEVETRVFLGDLSVGEGVRRVREYMDNNDFREWHAAKMEIYLEQK